MAQQWPIHTSWWMLSMARLYLSHSRCMLSKLRGEGTGYKRATGQPGGTAFSPCVITEADLFKVCSLRVITCMALGHCLVCFLSSPSRAAVQDKEATSCATCLCHGKKTGTSILEAERSYNISSLSEQENN